MNGQYFDIDGPLSLQHLDASFPILKHKLADGIVWHMNASTPVQARITVTLPSMHICRFIGV